MSEENAPVGLVLGPGATPASDFQDDYWEQVGRTLREVFGDDANERVDALRRKVEDAEPGTQTAFYHAEPFDVAADLAGRRGKYVTVERHSYVEQILRSGPENAASSVEPGRRHLEG